jgi:hypothetical protein
MMATNTHLLELYENRLNAIMQEELIKIGSRKKKLALIESIKIPMAGFV